MYDIKKVKSICEKVASEKTAYDPKKWSKKIKLSQHCGAVSYIVQSIFGGQLVGGKVNGERHIWNRLKSGEVDLTSDQYGGDGFNAICKGKILKPRKTVNPKFVLFETLVKKYLK